MKQISFAAMNNGNVKIIVTTRRYSLTHFDVILKIWVELRWKLYADMRKIAALITASTISPDESNDYWSHCSESMRIGYNRWKSKILLESILLSIMPSFRYSVFDPIALDGNRITSWRRRLSGFVVKEGKSDAHMGFPKKLRPEIARNDKSARINRYIVIRNRKLSAINENQVSSALYRG